MSACEIDARQRQQWSLYVLRCRDGTLYAGISTDVERRLREHNSGHGARYTRGRLPVELAGTWRFPDESAVRRAEARFKRMPRRRKLGVLILQSPP